MNTIIYDVVVDGSDNHGAREDAARLIAARRGIRIREALEIVDEAVNLAVAEPLALTIRVDQNGEVKASLGLRWLKPVIRAEAVDPLVIMAEAAAAKEGK